MFQKRIVRPSPKAFDSMWHHGKIYLSWMEFVKHKDHKINHTYDILIRGQMNNFDKGDGLCQIIFKPDQFLQGSVYEGQVKECINKHGDKLMMFDGWGRFIKET